MKTDFYGFLTLPPVHKHKQCHLHFLFPLPSMHVTLESYSVPSFVTESTARTRSPFSYIFSRRQERKPETKNLNGVFLLAFS